MATEYNQQDLSPGLTVYDDEFKVRNCSITKSPSDEHNIHVGVTDPDGYGVIDYCYIEGGGIYVHPNYHAGTLYVKNAYICRAADNALYADEPYAPYEEHPLEPSGGTIHIGNCYFRDNNISHVRINAGCGVQNTVVENTGNVPVHSNGGHNSRGLHTFYGYDHDREWTDVEADNLDVEITDANSGDAIASAFNVDDQGHYDENPAWYISDSDIVGDIYGDTTYNPDNVGSNPDTSVPSGVPTSASEARSGTNDGEPGLDGGPIGSGDNYSTSDDGGGGGGGGGGGTIDTFDDQDFTEYSHTNSDSVDSYWTWTTSPARSNYAAQRDGGGGYNQQVSAGGDGLNAYPQQSDRISTWVRVSNTGVTQMGFFFMYDDDNNRAFARILPSSGDLEVYTIESGTVDSLTTTWSPSAGAWYELVVEWDDGSTFGGSAGDMTAYLYDSSGNQVASVGPVSNTTNDGTGTGQAYGVFSDPNGYTTYHDEATIPNREPDPVSEGTVIDDFEDGDIAEYTNTANNGTSAASTDVAVEGSYSLYQTHSGTDYEQLISESGLDQYPASDGTTRVYLNLQAAGNTAYFFYFACQSETELPNGYTIAFMPESGELAIVKDASDILASTTGISWGNYTNQWLFCYLDWQSDGSIIAEMYEHGQDPANDSAFASVSTVDTTYESGGVGFEANDRGDTATVYWDYLTASNAAGDGLTIDSIGEPSLGSNKIDWTVSETPDSQTVEYARRYPSGYAEWREIASLGSSPRSYTHDGAAINPGGGGAWVRYRVTADLGTETVSDWQSNLNNKGPNHTVAGRRRQSTNWAVEVIHPDTTRPRRPTLRGEPEYLPQVNGLPRIRVPVQQDETWLSESWENAKMYVWHGEKVYPIEKVERVEPREDHYVLVGVGGTELLQRDTYMVNHGGENIHGVIDTLVGNVTNMRTAITAPTDPPQVPRRMLDGNVLRLVNELAEQGGYVWEARVDPQASQQAPPDLLFELAQPGDRTPSESHQPVLDFELTKTLEDAYDYVRVQGTRTEQAETFTTGSSFPETINLSVPELWRWSADVTNTDGSGDYRANWETPDGEQEDYTVYAYTGELYIPSGSSLATSTTYRAAYDWKPSGEAGSTGPDTHELVETLSGIEDANAAQTAADFLYDRLSQPLVRGEVTVPYPEPDEPLVVNRAFDGLPTSGGVSIENVSYTNKAVGLTVGSRGATSEVLGQLRARLDTMLDYNA